MSQQLIGGKFSATYTNVDGFFRAGVGYKLYTYVSGTLTAKQTFIDSALTAPNANPVIMDARGEASIFLANGAYTLVLKDPNDLVIWTRDGIVSSDDTSNSALAVFQSSLASTNGSSFVGGNAQHVNSVSALRLLSKTSPSKYAFVTGYYSAFDGGGGEYVLDLSDTTSTDDGGTTIVAADGGRWKMAFSGDINAQWFGVQSGNTGVDYTSNINAAILAAKNLGRGSKKVLLPPGRIKISSTITIDSSGILLQGAGGSINQDSGGFAYITILDWYGSAGGNMILMASPAGGQKQNGGGVCGLKFGGGSGPNVAGRGVLVQSWDGAILDDLFFEEFSNASLEIGIISGALLSPKDSQHNMLSRIGGRTVINNGVGLLFSGDSSANASFNVGSCINFIHKNGVAMSFGSADNNHITQFAAFRQPAGTAYGVEFQGAASGGSVARSNHIIHCSASGGIIGKGTPAYAFASHDNTVHFIDKDNSTPNPVIESGSSVWYTDDYNRDYSRKLVKAAFGANTAQADAASTATGVSTTTAVMISDASGDHLRLTDGSNIWGINISSGNIRIIRLAGTGGIDLGGGACDTTINGGVGFYGGAPVSSRQNITGSRSGNAALQSLLVALAANGLITNSTTA